MYPIYLGIASFHHDRLGPPSLFMTGEDRIFGKIIIKKLISPPTISTEDYIFPLHIDMYVGIAHNYIYILCLIKVTNFVRENSPGPLGFQSEK